MSLRKIAKELRVSPAYLSYMVSGKRPWKADLYQRYQYFVNTSVNTPYLNVHNGRKAVEPVDGVSRGGVDGQALALVGRVGFEPTTRGLKVRCSARLS